jgi:hypothetical protein
MTKWNIISSHFFSPKSKKRPTKMARKIKENFLSERLKRSKFATVSNKLKIPTEQKSAKQPQNIQSIELKKSQWATGGTS